MSECVLINRYPISRSQYWYIFNCNMKLYTALQLKQQFQSKSDIDSKVQKNNKQAKERVKNYADKKSREKVSDIKVGYSFDSSKKAEQMVYQI